MTEQLLRQALNKVDVWGFAQSSTLEEKEFIDKQSGKPYKAIAGDVTIRVNDDESHTLSYFSKELTNKGAVSKNFKSLQTAMSEMITAEDVAQGLVTGEVSMLTCQGELTLNEYKSQDGEIVSFPRINGKFAPSRFKGEAADFAPKAKFDIEGIVTSNVVNEFTKEGDETGRLIIKIYTPNYKGEIIPLEFLTSSTLSQNNKDYLTDNFIKNASINIYGDLINKSKKIVRVVEAGFGESKTDITYERIREFIVIGGALYEEGVNKEAFDVSLLQDAISMRQRHLAALQAKVNETKDKKAGFGEEAPKNAPGIDDSALGDLDLFGDD